MLIKHILRTLCLLIAFAACRPSGTDGPTSILQRLENDRLPDSLKIKLIQEADSLARMSGNDSTAFAVHTKAGALFLKMGRPQEAKGHFLWTVEAARKNNDPMGLASALNNTAIAWDDLAETDSALKYYEEATKLFRTSHDSLRLAQTLINMGILYKNKDKHALAVDASIEAAKILEASNNKQALSDAYSTIGNSLKSLGQLELALTYHEKSLAIRLAEQDSVGIAGSFNNIGNVYRNQKKYDQALQRYFEALAIKEKLGNQRSVATTIDNIATAYLEQRQFPQARSYFGKALAIRKAIDDKEGVLTTMNRLCKLYLDINDLKSAEALAKEGEELSRRLQYLKHQIDNINILTEIHRRAGRPQEALRYALLNLSLKDSLLSRSVSTATFDAEARFRTKAIDQQLALVNQLKDRQAFEIKMQRTSINVLLLLLVMLFTAMVLLVRANKKVNVLFKELAHRIDNNLQILLGILLLKKYSTGDPGQRAALDTIEERINAMIAIHNILKGSAYNKRVKVAINKFITDLVTNINNTYANGSDHFTIQTDLLPVYFDGKRAVTIGLLINEILTNLYKHGRLRNNHCTIDISLQSKDKKYVLMIADDCGPWTAPHTKDNKGMGLDIIETLGQQLKGKLTTGSTAGGTTVTLFF